MTRRNGPIPEETQKEIIDLYISQPDTTVDEIRKSYGLSLSSMYDLLNEHDIPRRGYSHYTPRPPVKVVKVDKEDFVQEVTPVPAPKAKVDQWIVKFTAEVTVDAESIDQALAEVRRLGTARRIYSIRLK